MNLSEYTNAAKPRKKQTAASSSIFLTSTRCFIAGIEMLKPKTAQKINLYKFFGETIVISKLHKKFIIKNVAHTQHNNSYYKN